MSLSQPTRLADDGGELGEEVDPEGLLVELLRHEGVVLLLAAGDGGERRRRRRLVDEHLDAERDDGETLVFSIVVNGFTGGAGKAMDAVDRLAGALIEGPGIAAGGDESAP